MGGIPGRIVKALPTTVRQLQKDWDAVNGIHNPSLAGFPDHAFAAQCTLEAVGAARGTPPRRRVGVLDALPDGTGTWVSGDNFN